MLSARSSFRATAARRRARDFVLFAALLTQATCDGRDSTAPGSTAIADIALTTTAVLVAPQQTLKLTATPRDGAGNPLTGHTVVWSSSQPAVATVDNSGLVTAQAPGMATLTAMIDGKSGSVTITVRLPVLPPSPPGVDTVSALGSWTLVLSRPITSKYEGLAFPDSLHGWVVSDKGDIIATANGGVTWTQQASGLGILRSVDFIDSTHGFAGTLLGVLYRTIDGGTTWTDVTSTLPKTPVGFCGMTHVGNHVHIVGRYFGATDYYSSPDGGATWQYTNLSALMGGLVDVAFVTQSIGFISGAGIGVGRATGPATVLKTTDGGATWRTVFTNDAGLGWAWKIFVVSANVIYVSVESDDDTYRVLKSVDGGETWAVEIVATGQPTGTSNTGFPAGGLQGIGFLDANVGWVGGFFTGMFATTNGGASWSPVTTTSAYINRYRPAGSTLFTAGTQGILRYDARH
jgi:photosystem II stability/assembly factor-like uncharacterized protein